MTVRQEIQTVMRKFPGIRFTHKQLAMHIARPEPSVRRTCHELYNSGTIYYINVEIPIRMKLVE